MSDSLAVWLLPADGTDKAVVWLWARSTPTASEIGKALSGLPDSTRQQLKAEIVEYARQQETEAVLKPGDWPLADDGATAELVAGERLLETEPARLVLGILRAHRTDTPNRWHYQAAAVALRREGVEVTPKTRNNLAEDLRAECCRLRLPEAAGLDELNTIATEAIEQIDNERLDSERTMVNERPLFWWAEVGPSGVGRQLRFGRALAQSLHRRNLKLRPAIPMPLATMILRSGVERTETASNGYLQHRADDGTTRAAAAQVHLAERALGLTAPPGVVPLAAYLATVCYQQHRSGLDEARARSVAIPSTSREALRPFGIETPAELRVALDWLQATSIGDPRFESWTCVTSHGQAANERRSSAKGGRPHLPGYIVDVGYPLAPFAASRLQDTFRTHGMTPPPSLGFFAPVLPVQLAPPAAPNSYGPTRKRQLDAYCMALPLVLMERREEYAERGILLDDLRAPLRKVGIYSRGKGDTSLFDSLRGVWTATPEPALFSTRTSPVLVPVEPGSARYRLGPDYADADGMIVDAAGFTEQRRIDGRKGRSTLMLQRTKR